MKALTLLLCFLCLASGTRLEPKAKRDPRRSKSEPPPLTRSPALSAQLRAQGCRPRLIQPVYISPMPTARPDPPRYPSPDHPRPYLQAKARSATHIVTQGGNELQYHDILGESKEKTVRHQDIVMVAASASPGKDAVVQAMGHATSARVHVVQGIATIKTRGPEGARTDVVKAGDAPAVWSTANLGSKGRLSDTPTTTTAHLRGLGAVKAMAVNTREHHSLPEFLNQR